LPKPPVTIRLPTVNPDDRFRYLLLAGFLVLVSIGVLHRVRAGTGEALDRKQEGVFILVALRLSGLAGLVGMVIYLLNPAILSFAAMPLPNWLRWVGVGLGCITALLLFWTLQTLGKNLTDTVVTRKEHALVTNGPYRWVRHPFYGCAALIATAASLISANAFFLVIGASVLLLLAFRTRIEERNLLNRFGDDYRNYMQRTGRFFPRL
jgi:protein-S-isoprenylcysteine O-methyltransferase Ste14